VPVMDGPSTYVQEPKAIGRRGCTERFKWENVSNRQWMLAVQFGSQSRTRAMWVSEYKWLCYFISRINRVH